MGDFSEKDILRYASENGIINIAYVREQIEMQKREELLKKHPYKIWQGKDGKWYTYLPDDEKGRRKIKKTERKSLENVLIDFYKMQEVKQETFDDVYWHWRSVQDITVSRNTVIKYNSDYKRFFASSEFAKKRIDGITEEDIKVFVCGMVKSKHLCKQACKTLYLYIANVFKSAKINRIITQMPTEFLAAKQFYKYCTEKERNIDSRLVSDDDMRKLYEQFHKDHIQNPSYIPTYAVELATLTGMRVGEIAALMWECVMDTYIIINKSEKYDRDTGEYYIDKTKNGKERIFPITDEIRELLYRVKEVETKYGYLCEFVFANSEGRIHTSAISSCSKNKCRQIGITEKGIHAYRRTVNSKMRCGGVSATVAAALLGHTEEVNERYYTFDITDIKEKADIVSQVNARTVGVR